MNKAWLALGLACSVTSALVFACVGDEKSAAPDEADGGSQTTPNDGATDSGSAPACTPKPYDFEGCACENPGALRECFQGVPGPESACKNSGSQGCELNTSTWGPCTGGDKPDSEVCFDGIDNDCDGVVDNGCRCTPDVDVCKLADGGALADGLHVIVDPPTPKPNVPFDFYVVTTGPLDGTLAFMFNNLCYGSGSRGTCATAGKNCGAWRIARFRNSLPAGNHMISIWSDPGSTPCVGSRLVTNYPLTIQP